MAADTKIEWADHTFNPWLGCAKISPACDHCYAERSTPARTLAIQWGPHAERRRTSPATWALPTRWNAQAEAFQAQHGRRQRVFCASLADVFDNAVPREWRDDLATVIAATPDLDWLLLTKRIGNAAEMLGDMFLDGPPDNIWLGATICNQEEADRDIAKLLAVPAAKRFLSIEPLLRFVDLTNIEVARAVGVDVFSALEYDGAPDEDVEFGTETIDWVIVGGESGPSARPMHPDWVRSLRDQCNAAGVPFFFKQWGEWWEVGNDERDENGNHFSVDPESYEGREMWDAETDCLIHIDGRIFTPNTLPDDTPARLMTRIGKKAAGRLLDGREWNEVPA